MKKDKPITLKINLQHDYKWSTKDKPGTQDDLLFNRKEGLEVSTMIQSVVDKMNYTDKSEVYRVEDMIAQDLPGNIRSKEKVTQWLLTALAPEHKGITYMKSLDLEFFISEGSAGVETFCIPRGSKGENGDLRTILDFARTSDYVFSYGTKELRAQTVYDPTKDYQKLNDKSPLFSDRHKMTDRQGWYQKRTYNGDEEYLVVPTDDSPEGYESIGEKVLLNFGDTLEGKLDCVAIYNNPHNELTSGVFIWYGVDPSADKLVGFMMGCVQT